jgi:CelD/BcsL family acetyltransferase involved in cellulose biosynthesis
MRWLTINELNTLWPTLIEFHQNRWQNKGEYGAFSSDNFNQFHQMLIKNQSSSVAASAVFVNNFPIAIHYYLVGDDTCHFYQSGWDEKNFSKLSPGLFLHYWSIKNCPKKYYDFMMGGVNNSYKAKFNASARAMLSITLIKNPIKLFVSKIVNKLTRPFN